MNLITVFNQFPDHNSCISHLESIRWSDRATCPYCKSDKCTPVDKEKRHHCNNCNTSFSVTVGTIFHHTHLSLQKWFLAITLILNAKKGISARQLARDLNVNKNTGWRISMHIRKAMCERWQRDLLTGIVEADETYVGGKPRKGNGGNSRGKPGPRPRKISPKIPVVGFVERGGKVKAHVIGKKSLNAKNLNYLIRQTVDTKNTRLITDESSGYNRVKRFMQHDTINHSIWYVDGDIHTNNIESFWATLKRGIIGQFHKVSLRYLPMYMDEFCYRYNNRKSFDIFTDTLTKGLETRP